MHQSIGQIMGIKTKKLQLLELLFLHEDKVSIGQIMGIKNKGNAAARVIVLACS